MADFRQQMSDPRWGSALSELAAESRAPAAAIPGPTTNTGGVYDPSEILKKYSTDYVAPDVVNDSGMTMSAPSANVATVGNDQGFLANIAERGHIGAIDNPEQKLAALEKIYGAGKVTPTEDNFLIDTGSGFRDYNPTSWGSIVSDLPADIASVVPDIGGFALSVPGAILGASAGTAVAPGVGTFIGGAAGAGAGNALGKAATAKLISYLAGDENDQFTTPQLTRSFLEGAGGEVVGHGLRLGAAGFKALPKSANPLVQWAGLVGRDTDPARQLAAQLGDPIFADSSAAMGRYANAVQRGVEPTMAEVTGDAGLTSLANAGAISGRAGARNKAVAQGLMDDAAGFTRDQGINTLSDIGAVQAAQDIGTNIAGNLDKVSQFRKGLYSGVDNTGLVDPDVIRKGIIRDLQMGSDPAARIINQERPTLASATFDMLDRRGIPGTRAPGYGKVGPARGYSPSRSEQEGFDILNSATRNQTPINTGDVADLLGEYGYRKGLSGPTLAQQNIYREALGEAHPALKSANEAASPYYKFAEDAGRYLTPEYALRSNRIGSLNKVIESRKAPDWDHFQSLDTAISSGALSPEQGSKVARDVLGAMTHEQLMKADPQVLGAFAEAANNSSRFTHVLDPTTGEIISTPGAATIANDLAHGQGLSSIGEEVSRNIRVSKDALENSDRVFNRLGRDDRSHAPILAFLSSLTTNPLAAAGRVAANMTIPGGVAGAYAKEGSGRGLARLSEIGRMRKLAAEDAGLKGYAPFRDFSPAFRNSVRAQNAASTNRASVFDSLTDLPAGFTNPYDDALIDLPAMGSLNTRGLRETVMNPREALDRYISGVSETLPSTIFGQVGGRSAADYHTGDE